MAQRTRLQSAAARAICEANLGKLVSVFPPDL